MLAPSHLRVGFGAVFTVLLVLAVGYDVKQRRIPNALVVATIALGITFALLTVGAGRGALSAAEGAAVGLALWLPWWWFGMMGAGDVKFFAAAAVWLGPRGALGAALITALLGGLIGIGWLAARAIARKKTGGAASTAADSGAEDRATFTLPYGVAMALGLGVAAWIPLIR